MEGSYMFVPNAKTPKNLAGFGLLLTASLLMSACSSSRVSSEKLDGVTGPVEVQDTEFNKQPAPEPQVASSDTLSSEVPFPQSPRKYKKLYKRRHLVRHQQTVKKSLSAVAQEVKPAAASSWKEKDKALLGAAGSIGELPPSPPTSLTPLIIDTTLEASAGRNWIYVTVAGILGLSLMTLGIRARRQKTPRRLVLNS
jgi:hypothetical protein